MLQRIHIRNYAIIDELTIEFEAGLNIITGETGAGKSILMGALGLVLGDRADTAVLFSTEEKCVVEAVFHPADATMLAKLLEANDLDADEQLVVRREISVAGKSRSFVNDTPVNLQVLRQFATQMVDLHRQFDTLDLGEDDFQRNVLDALAGNQELVPVYKQHFASYSKAKQQLASALKEQANAAKELDYYRFLFTELEEANFAESEIEEAETEFEVL
jgi:DNA repair protein RecN (Recombination protein N)